MLSLAKHPPDLGRAFIDVQDDKIKISAIINRVTPNKKDAPTMVDLYPLITLVTCVIVSGVFYFVIGLLNHMG
jgi:hypothetical protein